MTLAIQSPLIKFDQYNFEIPELSINKFVAGVDPGTTRIGIAIFTPIFPTWIAFELHMERLNTTEERIKVFQDILSRFITIFPFTVNFLTVEGASYADRYRQVELEDIRAACVCWKKEPTILQIVPPMTIRKTVFGSGKIKNPWKEQGLPDNAAAALGCALYPIFKGEQK